MNATILDTITAAFVGALHTGQGALAQYALPLLAILATIAFYLQLGPLVAGGGVSAATFLAPSKVLDVGFRLGRPIRDYTDSLISWAAVWNWPILITYSLAY